MKKTSILVIILISIFFLFGCTSNASNTTLPSPQPNQLNSLSQRIEEELNEDYVISITISGIKQENSELILEYVSSACGTNACQYGQMRIVIEQIVNFFENKETKLEKIIIKSVHFLTDNLLTTTITYSDAQNFANMQDGINEWKTFTTGLRED